MQVMVRVNGILAQEMGAARFTMSLDNAATVQDLLQALQKQHPSLAGKLGQAVTVINGVHQPATAALSSGQQVALLMPIAGG